MKQITVFAVNDYELINQLPDVETIKEIIDNENMTYTIHLK